MDGVIADFDGWMKKHVPDINEYLWKNTSVPWDVMDKHYNTLYRDLDTLHLTPWMSSIYNNFNSVKFLTAIPEKWYGNHKGEIAKLNKTYWLEKHIENFSINDVIFTPSANNKIQYAEPRAVLYDDREDTILKWNKAGGIGVHVKGSTNDSFRL
jgi:hypothetical protein